MAKTTGGPTLRQTRRQRYLDPKGRLRIRRVGHQTHPVSDMYHLLLTFSWPRLILFACLVYFVCNSIFAVLYMAFPGCIENVNASAFLDNFFFSVQTMATIGYGRMAPVCLSSNLLVTVEAFFGMLSLAFMTGLLYSKFSRPTSRIMYSQNATVVQRDGVRSLIFRLANERDNRIFQAEVGVSLARDEITLEGEEVRRVYDLRLLRSKTPVFALSWTIVHPIDEKSPFFGQSSETMKMSDAEVIVSFVGNDEDFSQSVLSRHSYMFDEILWDHQLQDMFLTDPAGEVYMDLTKFHLTKPFNPELGK